MAEKPNLDGFYPRRPNTRGENAAGGGIGFNGEGLSYGRQQPIGAMGRPQPRPVLGSQPLARPDTYSVPSPSAQLGIRPNAATGSAALPLGLTRPELEESLRQIDQQKYDPSPNKPGKKRGRAKGAALPRRTKIIRWAVIILAAIGIVGFGYFAYKALSAGAKVFNGDVFGLIQQKSLQQDANGRTNILLLGTSEDDPGHQGANLTDSIMVLSIDQHAKNAYMFSVPRDLRVKYGQLCTPGSYGKINVFFSCVTDGDSKEAEQQRQTATRDFVGKIVGLDIQYSVHVNYTVVRDVVGALGNITVDIQGSGGAPGVMDSNFDWKCRGGKPYASLATMKQNCPPNGHFIDYPNGPATLDAEHALYLAQARGDTAPTYGLGRSNFDRELNQQKIIKAIKEKAMSAGTFTNIVTVSNLLDAMGNNLRTNFDTSEIRTLMSLLKDIPNNAVQSISLVDAQPALFGNDGEGNVAPLAGTYDYSDIQAYIQKKINATPVSKEGAHVIVLNASGIAGAAKAEGDKLTALGMNLDSVGNAPKGAYTTNMIYQIKKTGSDGLPNTAKKLQDMYGVAPDATSPLPDGVTPGTDTDFVIILLHPSSTTASSTDQSTTSSTTDQ